jgi:hypothetical protein
MKTTIIIPHTKEDNSLNLRNAVELLGGKVTETFNSVLNRPTYSYHIPYSKWKWIKGGVEITINK